MLNDDPAECVRCDIGIAIWKITGDPSDAVAVGIALLDDHDWTVRCLGVEHLMRIGPAATGAVPRLEEVIESDEDEGVREFARKALVAITSHD